MQQGGREPLGADHRVVNDRLAAAVPESARRVLQIGAGGGWLAPVLKARSDPPVVIGAESPGAPPVAGAAALDDCLTVDLEHDLPPLDPGSVDCIVYADALPRFVDPVAVLVRHRALLSPSGTIACSVPNLQHHGTVGGLLRGVFPYREGTLVEPSSVRLFTAAAVMQLLLDAGYAPHTTARIADGGAEAMAAAGGPLFELLGVGAKDAEEDLRTSRLVVRGVPLPPVDAADEVPLTVVACVNDDDQLGANLARSPCLRPGSGHELLVFRQARSAAEGLNAGIARARNPMVVLVHQDVYLPEGWPARLMTQWRTAASQGGDIGIAGVFGVKDRRVPFDATGRVVHRDRLLEHRRLPTDVDGLDELLMVVPRDTPLRVDEALGWHLYGTDLALQAQARHLRAVVLDAPCHHNSLTGRVPSAYRQSERVLARKWERLLPIHTNLSSIDTWLLEGGPGSADASTDTDDAVASADGGDGDDGAPARGGTAGGGGSGPATTDDAGLAALVTRLRREQVVLTTELEQARLQVASMRASPFWRARELYDAARRRLVRRR